MNTPRHFSNIRAFRVFLRRRCGDSSSNVSNIFSPSVSRGISRCCLYVSRPKEHFSFSWSLKVFISHTPDVLLSPIVCISYRSSDGGTRVTLKIKEAPSSAPFFFFLALDYPAASPEQCIKSHIYTGERRGPPFHDKHLLRSVCVFVASSVYMLS